MRFISRTILFSSVLLLSVGMSAQERFPQDDTVSVGFNRQPLWKVSGAVSSVGGETLRRSFTTDIYGTLFGRIPGLTVTEGSGEPGVNATESYIRGINTFGPERGYLIVVDGFVIEADQFDLSAAEIERISILKDAAALAIYGSRGANGVMLVETKRGHKGEMQVGLRAQVGFQNARRLPKYMDAADHATFYNEAYQNDGLGTYYYTPREIEMYRDGSDPYFHPNVDWYDETMRSIAPVMNYDLTFKGGGNTVRYFLMLDYSNAQNLFRHQAGYSENAKNPSWNRYGFRANLDIDVARNLEAKITLGGSITSNTTTWRSIGDAGNHDAWQDNSNNIFSLMNSTSPLAFPVFNEDGTYGGNSQYSNPLGEIRDRGFIQSNARNLYTGFRLNHRMSYITPGFGLFGEVGFNTYFIGYTERYRDFARYNVTETGVVTQFGQNGELGQDESRSYQWRNITVRGGAEYNRVFGKHDISAMAFFSYDSYVPVGRNLPYEHAGVFGKTTYSYDKRYVVELTAGYEGSDNFMKGNRFGFFPAVSAAWVISNEGFMQKADAVDFLKLRASYGLTGWDKIGGARYLYNQYVVGTNGYYFGTENTLNDAYREGRIANPDISWEKDRKLNVGIDARFLDRIDFSVDWFYNKRYDIVVTPSATVPAFLGMDLPPLNQGRLTNTGFELSLRYENGSQNQFRWYAGANLWFARNRIDFQAEHTQVYDYLYSTGHQVGKPFVLQSDGLFCTQQEIDESGLTYIWGEIQPGDIIYKDMNGDHVIDDNDIYPTGYSNIPELTMNLDTGFEYRNFDFSFLFQAVTNRNVIYNPAAFQGGGRIPEMARGRWTTDNPDRNASYPRLTTLQDDINYRNSTFWMRNGSFLKLRNVELGYTFKDIFREGSALRVFLNGTNLFSIDYMGNEVDPEYWGGYPTVRTVSLGASVTF